MTPAQLADAIAENIESGRLAGHFLARPPAKILDPDKLLRALLLAQAASPNRLRGFARRLQKQLERGRPMRSNEGDAAGREGCPDRTARDEQRAAILKIAEKIGNFINCGARIRLVAGVTTCPTCSAWRRWYIAHRIASQALREAIRDA